MPHEFTPGPWRQYERDPLVITAADGGSIGEMTCGGPPGTMPHGEQLANARLTAQAPRLLKHLEKAYAQLVRQGSSCNRLNAEEMDAMQRAIGDAGGSTE